MRRTSLVIALVLAAGCGDGALNIQGTSGVDRAGLGEGEVFYVHDGVGAMTLEAAQGFGHIDFHFSLANTELRALDAAGEVVLDWTEVARVTDDDDPVAHEGLLSLPREASVIELVMRTPVEFARIEVGPGSGSAHEGDSEPAEGGVTTLAAHSGRWIPPAHVVERGNHQYLPYTGAPARCSGTFLPGTRAVAEHLKQTFPGAVSYGGYNCRANTANRNELSVHASGRAIDLFVPLSGGQADNDLGDPIANYLVENAEKLGIEFIVWDRTSWGAHRSAPKHRAYTGPHPHHDHLHIEVAPRVASGNGPALDQSPRGYLDVANCDGIGGWAQDPDAPHQGIKVYVSMGGPVFTPGSHGAWAVANEHRGDLCTAIGSCAHGYYTKVPHGLMDGVTRDVYVYGEDVTGGQNSQLSNAPRQLRCDPPRLPYTGQQAVKRHIPNPESLAAWGFQWNDIIKVDDGVLASFADGRTWPQTPTLLSEGLAIFVVEGTTKRHVPNPRAMNNWGLDWGAVRPADLGSLRTLPPLEQRPYLVQGSGPAVYVLVPK